MDAPLTENRFSPILSRSSRIATGFRTRREAAGGDLRRVRGGRTGDRGAESSARTVAANTGPRSWLGVARQILLLVRLVRPSYRANAERMLVSGLSSSRTGTGGR